MSPKPQETKKRGRRPKDVSYPRAIFTRTTEETAGKLEGLAKRYRVSVADLLRWMVDDAVNGQWEPSHLKSVA